MIKADKWYLNPATGQIDIGEAWLLEDDVPKGLVEWDEEKPVNSFLSGSHFGTKTATFIHLRDKVTDVDFRDETWQSTYWQTEEQAAQAWEDHDAMFVEHVE